MSYRLRLQYALSCLHVLDAHSSELLSARDLSRLQGIPFEELKMILQQLTSADILVCREGGFRLARSIADIKALELIDALSQPLLPAFRPMATPRTSISYSRELAQQIMRCAERPSDVVQTSLEPIDVTLVGGASQWN